MSTRQQSVELKLKAYDESGPGFDSYAARLRKLEGQEREAQAKIKATSGGRDGPDTEAINKLAQVRRQQAEVQASALAESDAARAKQAEAIEQQNSQRIADLRTQTAARQLRDKRRFAEAEIVELKAAHSRELAQIEEMEAQKIALLTGGEEAAGNAEVARIRASTAKVKAALLERQEAELASAKKVAGGAGAGGVKGFLAGLRETQMEERRSGVRAFESLLHGAGVAAIYVAAVKGALDGTKEFAKALAEFANGTATAGEAFSHFTERLANDIPIVSSITKAYSDAHDAWSQMNAAMVKAQGATEAEQDEQLSDSAYLEKYTQRVKEQTAALETLRKARLRTEGADLVGEDAEKHGKNREFEQQIAELTKQREDFKTAHRSELGVVTLDNSQQKVLEGYNQAIAITQNAQADALKKIDEKAGGDRQKLVEESEHKIAQIRQAAALQGLRDTTTAYDAEVAALRAKTDDEIAQIRRKAEADKVGKTVAAQAVIGSNADKEAAAVAEANNAALKAAGTRHNREIEAAARENVDRVSSIRDAAAEADLRARHRDAEAELLELRSAHQKELAEIDRQLKEKSDKLRASTYAGHERDLADAQRQAEELKAAVDAKYQADTGRASIRAGDESTDRTAQTQNTLLEARVGLLRELAEGGNTLAGIEAERLQAVEATQAKLKEINRQLRDGKDLTAEQRANLEQAAALYGQREADLKAEEGQKRQNAVLESRIELLRTIGESGNKQASIEAEQLTIRMTAEKKLASLRKQLATETNADNKKALEEQIGLTEQQERLKLVNAANKSGEGEWKAAPGKDEGKGVLGLAAAAEVNAHNADFEYRQKQLASALKGAGDRAAEGQGSGDRGRGTDKIPDAPGPVAAPGPIVTPSEVGPGSPLEKIETYARLIEEHTAQIAAARVSDAASAPIATPAISVPSPAPAPNARQVPPAVPTPAPTPPKSKPVDKPAESFTAGSNTFVDAPGRRHQARNVGATPWFGPDSVASPNARQVPPAVPAPVVNVRQVPAPAPVVSVRNIPPAVPIVAKPPAIAKPAESLTAGSNTFVDAQGKRHQARNVGATPWFGPDSVASPNARQVPPPAPGPAATNARQAPPAVSPAPVVNIRQVPAAAPVVNLRNVPPASTAPATTAPAQPHGWRNIEWHTHSALAEARASIAAGRSHSELAQAMRHHHEALRQPRSHSELAQAMRHHHEALRQPRAVPAPQGGAVGAAARPITALPVFAGGLAGTGGVPRPPFAPGGPGAAAKPPSNPIEAQQLTTLQKIEAGIEKLSQAVLLATHGNLGRPATNRLNF